MVLVTKIRSLNFVAHFLVLEIADSFDIGTINEKNLLGLSKNNNRKKNITRYSIYCDSVHIYIFYSNLTKIK